MQNCFAQGSCSARCAVCSCTAVVSISDGSVETSDPQCGREWEDLTHSMPCVWTFGSCLSPQCALCLKRTSECIYFLEAASCMWFHCVGLILWWGTGCVCAQLWVSWKMLEIDECSSIVCALLGTSRAPKWTAADIQAQYPVGEKGECQKWKIITEVFLTFSCSGSSHTHIQP